jgi:hypothetical protein
VAGVSRIVGVHGIGNYHYYRRARSVSGASEAISADWASWLASPVELSVAYYAHHLHRGVVQGDEDDPALLEPGAQELLVAWVEQLQPRAQVALGPRTARARQAAEWLSRRFGRAARVAAIGFCREVHTYLAEPGSARRVAAREAVADVIEAQRPGVVVAHSLGSVVAYEALWARPDLGVEVLVTLGSPLGMPGVVFERLRPATGGRGARPPGVGRWVNLADAGDIVAVPRDLGECFDGIDVHRSDLRIGEWDFHTVRSYLACPDTVEVLRPYLPRC